MSEAAGNEVAVTRDASAARSRTYRRRRKRGLLIARVAISTGELDTLAARGYEGARQRGDRAAIDAAVTQLVSDVLFG